jgi:uncharacterized oligopeptide transporter (OPT) family protein
MIMMGIGAIFGIKAGISMLVAALLNYGVLAPILINRKVITHPAPSIQASQALDFPLIVPANSALQIVIEEADKSPELSGGAKIDTLTYIWPYNAEYADFKTLKDGLNSPCDLTGYPNPFYGKLVFSDTLNKSILQEVLTVTAPKSIHWEAKMTISETGTAGEVLGFTPGVSRLEAPGQYRNIVAWSMWPGVAILVVSGLLSFAFQYKTMGRTFASITKGFRKKKGDSDDILEHLEVPGKWFLIGIIVTAIPCVLLQNTIFAIPLWMGEIAVVMSFFLAAVAARTTAEVGIIPIGAMGKVTQLLYGVISPGNMVTNLMAANITAGSACSCADTIGNLKIGNMVGAHPRKQFLAQMAGVIGGSLFCVPAYYFLVPDVNILGGDKFPAPSAIVWAGVAKLLARGLSTLPPSAIVALIIGAIFAVIVTLIDKYFPSTRKYTPSCAAIGIALTIPGWNSISMFLGSFAAEIFMWVNKEADETYRIPLASGFIAGESLAGVAVASLMTLGIL